MADHEALPQGLLPAARTGDERQQRALCDRYGSEFWLTADDDKVGATQTVRGDAQPVHGLRHRPEPGTTGWFLWAGDADVPQEDDAFAPLHVHHLEEWRPEVVPYLGLGPGWRFIVAPGYEDVWFDESLLDVTG